MNKQKNIIAIGGVGGSGTRVISQILKESGYFTGDDLNNSEDNLLFTLLFKRQNILTENEDNFNKLVALFVKIMSKDITLADTETKLLYELASDNRTLHTKEWLQERVAKIQVNTIQKTWGWKEPNTHIIIEKLFSQIENLKFVYVYRNGLDMAYSDNQNQLRLWGSIFFNDYNIEINPQNSLHYWCITHKRILELQKKFNKKIYMLDFDKLCFSPDDVLQEFSNFIEYKGDILEFTKLIKAPASIGRYKKFPMTHFYKEDLEFFSNIYKI